MIDVQRQLLPYSVEQMFDLVADVGRYPEFLPWVTDARVRRQGARTLLVSMTVASGPLRKRFTTLAVLDRPNRIDVGSTDPLFTRFRQRWTFERAGECSTLVEYALDFKFRSSLLQMLVGAAFGRQVTATMAAFTRRAKELYGKTVCT